MTLLTFVADTHLGPTSPGADDNWRAVVAHVARNRPSLVVHAGDVSLDGADHDGDLAHSRELLDELPVRWRAVPGNHDTGDIGEDPRQPVDDARRLRYRTALGDQFWIEDLDQWRVVGIDTQYLGSDLDGAPEAWDWLTDALRTDRRTVVVGHRPLHPDGSAHTDAPHRYLQGRSRERLQALLADGPAELYVSGHVHQWRHGSLAGFDYVWVPSTWAILPDRMQEPIGDKVVGLVEIELAERATVPLCRTGRDQPGRVRRRLAVPLRDPLTGPVAPGP